MYLSRDSQCPHTGRSCWECVRKSQQTSVPDGPMFVVPPRRHHLESPTTLNINARIKTFLDRNNQHEPPSCGAVNIHYFTKAATFVSGAGIFLLVPWASEKASAEEKENQSQNARCCCCCCHCCCCCCCCCCIFCCRTAVAAAVVAEKQLLPFLFSIFPLEFTVM
jgi:hypothetical protein